MLLPSLGLTVKRMVGVEPGHGILVVIPKRFLGSAPLVQGTKQIIRRRGLQTNIAALDDITSWIFRVAGDDHLQHSRMNGNNPIICYS